MKISVFVSDYKLTTDILERMKAEKLGLIFVANGVYHAALKVDGKPCPVLDLTTNLYALSEDLATRGIDAASIDKRVKVVTYDDVVDLIFNEYEKTAWI